MSNLRGFGDLESDCYAAGGNSYDPYSGCYDANGNLMPAIPASTPSSTPAGSGGGTVAPGTTKVVPYQTQPSFFSQHPWLILGGVAALGYLAYHFASAGK